MIVNILQVERRVNTFLIKYVSLVYKHCRMSLKFPISLAGKRGGGFPLGVPTNYWDLDDSAHTNSIDVTRNMVDIGGVNVIESNTAPDGGGCTVTSNTTHIGKTITGTSPVTISAWVEFVVNPPKYSPWFTWRNTAVNGTMMMVGRSTNATAQSVNIHGAASKAVDLQTVTDGWRHDLVTYDGNVLRTYVDGVSQGTNSNYSCTVCTRSRPMRLGRNWGAGHHPCKFAMLGHWEAAPTNDAEAQATADYLYNGGVGRRFADI